MTEAKRDSFNALEEKREIQRKLDDELFLAGNQKCTSCQANERMRESFAEEIANLTKANEVKG